MHFVFSIAIVTSTLLNWPIVSLLILFYSILLNWPIVSLLILFYSILFSNVSCVLVHDSTLCFIGSPCCGVTYYNYISIWLYYIVIHLTGKLQYDANQREVM